MKNINKQAGQTITILLFFMAIAITVTTAAIIITLTNSQSGSRFQQGTVVLYGAESGAEDALMRLLRNPAYVGTTLGPTELGTANLNVEVCVSSPSSTLKIVTSSAKLNNYARVIEVQVRDNQGILTTRSWKEINKFKYCFSPSPTP